MAAARLSLLLMLMLVLMLAAISSASSSSASSLASWGSASGAQQCTREHTALTSDCLGQCYAGRPCVAYAGNAVATTGDSEPAACAATAFGTCVDAAGCALECFTNGPRDFAAQDVVGFSSYAFLVPFAGDGEAAAANDTRALPSKSNAVLQRIEPLSLLSVTTKVAIVGGSSMDGVVARGRTAEMHVADGFLAANPQLQSITLANLALRTLSGGALPTTDMANLSLRNCLLSTTYPSDLASMASLVRLDLSLNLFSDFPASLRLPALQELNLSANALESFRGALPSLISLDLSGNQLTSIPSSVFELPRLERLYLGGNKLAGVVLTESQLAFLQRLRVLSTDSLGDVSLCSSGSSAGAAATTSTTTAAQLVRVHGVDACALVASASATLDGSQASATSSSTTHNVATIAGTAVAGFLVLLAIVATVTGYVHRRRRQSKPRTRATSLADDPLAGALFRSPPPPYEPLEGQEATEQSVLRAHGLLPWRVDADDVHRMTDEFARGSRYVVDLAAFRHRFGHRSGIRKRQELYQGAIAVKRLRVDARDDARAREQLLTDVSVLSRLRHPQVTALIGVMLSHALGVQALLEFMEGGTLRAWLTGLRDAGESCAWTPIKAQLALDVAEALAYAHSRSPPLVHARLRGDKVLLTLDARAKLGHWRAFQPSGQSDDGVGGGDGAMGTVLLPPSGRQADRWTAPEVLTGSAAYSPASDVFALGLVLSELDTHRLPYEDGESGELVHHAGGISVLVASGRLRPVFSASKADGMPRELRVMAQRCLALDPRARATSSEVVLAFRAALAGGS